MTDRKWVYIVCYDRAFHRYEILAAPVVREEPEMVWVEWCKFPPMDPGRPFCREDCFATQQEAETEARQRVAERLQAVLRRADRLAALASGDVKVRVRCADWLSVDSVSEFERRTAR